MAKKTVKIMKCDKCHKETKDAGAVEINGRVRWLCYRCYKQQKD